MGKEKNDLSLLQCNGHSLRVCHESLKCIFFKTIVWYLQVDIYYVYTVGWCLSEDYRSGTQGANILQFVKVQGWNTVQYSFGIQLVQMRSNWCR